MNLHKPYDPNKKEPIIRLVLSYLHCNTCGKQVSTGFYPVETDTPDKGIIVRAFIQCPECMEQEKDND